MKNFLNLFFLSCRREIVRIYKSNCSQMFLSRLPSLSSSAALMVIPASDDYGSVQSSIQRYCGRNSPMTNGNMCEASSNKFDVPICSATVYWLSASQLKAEMSGALYLANSDSAMRLYNYYRFSDKSLVDSFFWLRIAHKLGNELGTRAYRGWLRYYLLDETKLFPNGNTLKSSRVCPIVNIYAQYENAIRKKSSQANQFRERLQVLGLSDKLLFDN